MNRLIRQCLRHIIEFNVFVPRSTSGLNEYGVQTRRIATRIFLITFTISLTVLLLSISTATSLHTVTISSPQHHQYEALYSQKPQSLTCPCERISINYQRFVRLNYTLHPICRSVYVTESWIANLTNGNDMLWVDDFRVVSPLIFQALRSLCQVAEESIQMNLEKFYSTNYISLSVTSQALFTNESVSIIRRFISSTTNSFSLSLRMIRDTFQGNSLLSALMTNYVVAKLPGLAFLQSISLGYDDGCVCTFSSNCTAKAFIYDNESRTSSWPVPFFYRGCFILEALRQSTLECFYSHDCLNELRLRFQPIMLMETPLLNSSESTHFYPSIRIGSIIDDMLVDRWDWNVSHENYYDGCQPFECSITSMKRDDIVSIVTKLISLVGGLVTILKLVILNVIRLIRWKFNPMRASTGMDKSPSLI